MEELAYDLEQEKINTKVALEMVRELVKESDK